MGSYNEYELSLLDVFFNPATFCVLESVKPLSSFEQLDEGLGAVQRAPGGASSCFIVEKQSPPRILASIHSVRMKHYNKNQFHSG